MVRLVRGAVVAFLAVLVAVVGALPSTAAVSPSPSPSASAGPVYGCIDKVDAYGAPRVCQLQVQILTPICDNEVPKLKYAVEAIGSPNTTVTVTFINPTGPDVVYADLPLTGTVNWPGAVVGPDGRGIDWPGWTKLADGTWVQGDEFDWVRPNVQVLFQVNPEATVTVAYPPSSPVCNTNPPDTEVLADNPTAAVLSATGSETQPLLLAGGALVLIGALTVALVSIARRRRPTA
ncbi:peptidase [Cellulomonas sp. ICMP 17802]|uniref:peptidase n=1 Tax=Cellulomonas sp. ICMP 17802 TaxID=3239199 RepID=UPI00351AED97